MAVNITADPDSLRDAFALLQAVADGDEQGAVILLRTLGDPPQVAWILAALFAGYVTDSGQDISEAVRLARREIPEE